MSITISSSPAYRSFVGNPVRFSLLTDSEQPLSCSLTIAGQVIYNFTHVPFQGVCQFDIADILTAYIDTPILESSQTDIVTPIRQGYTVYYTLTVTTGVESETVTFNGIAFRGGISKRLMRELQGKGLDMFSYRLSNPQRQFFFTTRYPENSGCISKTGNAGWCLHRYQDEKQIRSAVKSPGSAPGHQLSKQ